MGVAVRFRPRQMNREWGAINLADCGGCSLRRMLIPDMRGSDVFALRDVRLLQHWREDCSY